MKLISLYTGAGGLDLGFEKAGFEVAVGVEMDPTCLRTLAENRSWPIIAAPIQGKKGSSANILRTGSLEVGEADALIGGPPCQPFSKSAYWVRGDTRRLDDPRASTLEHYLRLVRDTQPRTFLLENVPGLGYRDKDEGIQLLRRTIADINESVGTQYTIEVTVLNAADFGVPQERQRLFVVGERSGQSFAFPAPTHRRESGEEAQLPLDDRPLTISTSWDAIGDLEANDDPELMLSGKWADLLPSIPEGENYLYHTARGGGRPLFGWRTRYWSFLLKLAKRLPSWTLTARPGPAIGPFHWKNRRLSMREMARIQTFPDDFHVAGNLRQAQVQLGNAVPAALGELLAREMATQLLGRIRPDRAHTLLPQKRVPVPEPEPPLRVSDSYSHLEGDHQPHPGTGRGPGALARHS